MQYFITFEGRNFVWLGFLGWYHGSPILSCGMRYQVHLWRPGSGRSCDDLMRNNGKDLKDSCNSIFGHGNHSISARWKFILYDELCLGKTVAFILFIWAKNIADRSGGCGRDHDSIFCLRNLCIQYGNTAKKRYEQSKNKPHRFCIR